MRFSDNIAKCHVTVKIMADGHECPQYNITGDEHGNMQCYIPLMSEQVITAEVELDMVSEHFEVDLFVDGVIRNFWQSTRNSVNKHRAPIVGFTQGIYKDTRSMYRSDMTTAVIPPSKRKSAIVSRAGETSRLRPDRVDHNGLPAYQRRSNRYHDLQTGS